MSRWRLTAFLYGLRRFCLWRHLLDQEMRACSALLRRVCTPERVLDLGTGQGTVRRLLGAAPVIVGVDGCAAMLRRARAHCILPVLANAVAPPFRAQVFDGITALGLSEYIPNEDLFFAAVAPLLTPGGWLLYTLSPPSLWTLLRRGLGHRLWARQPEESVQIAADHGFECMDKSATLMQAQLLFRLR